MHCTRKKLTTAFLDKGCFNKNSWKQGIKKTKLKRNLGFGTHSACMQQCLIKAIREKRVTRPRRTWWAGFATKFTLSAQNMALYFFERSPSSQNTALSSLESLSHQSEDWATSKTDKLAHRYLFPQSLFGFLKMLSPSLKNSLTTQMPRKWMVSFEKIHLKMKEHFRDY